MGWPRFLKAQQRLAGSPWCSNRRACRLPRRDLQVAAQGLGCTLTRLRSRYAMSTSLSCRRQHLVDAL